jgi:hypothetical protein
MTNDEFEITFKTKILEERKITNEILQLINEAEERRIHLLRGFPSLFAWLVHGMGYSESSAYRRIEAARLIRAVPAVAEKLQSGELNLTTVTKTRSAIRAHQKKTGKKLSAQEQAEVLRQVENKSSRATEQTLFELFPETASSVKQEREAALSELLTRLSFNLDQDAMKDLEWAKAFFSHAISDAEAGKIFARLLKDLREREEKKSTSAQLKPRVTNAHRVSLQRAERKCVYRDPKTGRVCGATFQVQSDHIVPKALGGREDLQNRQCLCRAHNALAAEQKLGRPWANSWRGNART